MRKIAFITIMVIVLMGGGYFAYQKFFQTKELDSYLDNKGNQEFPQPKEPGFYLNGKERMEILDIIPTITPTSYGAEFTIPDGYPTLSSAKSGTSTIQWHCVSDYDYQKRWDALLEYETLPDQTDSPGNNVLSRYYSKHSIKYAFDSLKLSFWSEYEDSDYMIACEKVSENQYLVRLRNQNTGDFCNLDLVRIKGSKEYNIMDKWAIYYFLPRLEPGVYLLNINGLWDFLPVVVE